MLVFADGTTMEAHAVCGYQMIRGKTRLAQRFEVRGVPYAELVSRFVDGLDLSIRVVQEDGSTEDCPYSDFKIAGDIVDRRDGSYWVYVGQKTQDEIKLSALVAAGTLTAEQYASVTGTTYIA